MSTAIYNPDAAPYADLVLDLPLLVETTEGAERVARHLPGKHNQKTHGSGGAFPEIGVVVGNTEGVVARYRPSDGKIVLGKDSLEAIDRLGARALYDLAFNADGKAMYIEGKELPAGTVETYGGGTHTFAHEAGHAWEDQFDLTGKTDAWTYDPDAGVVRGRGPDLGVGHSDRSWRAPSEAAADAFADYVQVPDRMAPEVRTWVEARLAEKPEYNGLVDQLRENPDPRYWVERGSIGGERMVLHWAVRHPGHADQKVHGRKGKAPADGVAALGDHLSVKDSDTRTVTTHLRELKELPPHIAEAFVAAGGRVEVGVESVGEHIPHLAEVTPRGWDQSGYTWDMVPGVYNEETHTVYAGNRGIHASDSLALHEFGHGADDLLGRPSRSPALSEAWETTVSSSPVISPYFRQPGRAGMQETFAEAFSLRVHRGAGDVKATFGKKYASAFEDWFEGVS